MQENPKGGEKIPLMVRTLVFRQIVSNPIKGANHLSAFELADDFLSDVVSPNHALSTLDPKCPLGGASHDTRRPAFYSIPEWGDELHFSLIDFSYCLGDILTIWLNRLEKYCGV